MGYVLVSREIFSWSGTDFHLAKHSHLISFEVGEIFVLLFFQQSCLLLLDYLFKYDVWSGKVNSE